MPSFFESLKQQAPEEQQGVGETNSMPSNSFFENLKNVSQEAKTSIAPRPVSGVLGQSAKELTAGALGTYGDIAELVGLQKKETPQVLTSQKERFMKEATATPEELISMSESDEVLPSYAKLPTSQDIRGAAHKFFGIGEPTTTKERVAGKVAGAIGGTAALGGGPLVSSTAGAGAAAGQAVRELEGPEWLATSVDIGTNVGAGLVKSLINKGSAQKFASSLYEAAESSLPEGASGNASKLEKSMIDLKKKMKLGTEAPSEKAIIDETEKILKKIKKGKMGYAEAVASKRSLNEKMMKLVYETPDKIAKGRAKKLFGQIKSEISNFIKTSSEKHPEFYKNQLSADQAFRTLAQSRVVSENIMDAIKEHPKAAIGYTLGVSMKNGLSKTLFGIATTATMIKPAEFIYRFLKSPVLRGHYNGLINSALKNNKAGILNNLRKINKGMEDDPGIMDLIENHQQSSESGS